MPSSGGHHLVICITALVHSLTSFAPITARNGDLSHVILTIADVGTQLQKMGDDLIGARSKHVLLLTTVTLFAWCLLWIELTISKIAC